MPGQLPRRILVRLTSTLGWQKSFLAQKRPRIGQILVQRRSPFR
jgi:hypothetical protein